MPWAEEDKQRMREEQRTKILEAARRVFARKGLAATMDDVATEASVSHGLAYRYFANKEAIIHVLVEQTVQSGIVGIQRLLAMPGRPGERLDFLVSMVLEGRRERPEFFQFFYQVLSDETIPDHLRELLSLQNRSYQDTMRQLIVEGQATGEVVEADPDQLVIVVMACLEGMVAMALRDPEQFNTHFPDAGIILRMLRREVKPFPVRKENKGEHDEAVKRRHSDHERED